MSVVGSEAGAAAQQARSATLPREVSLSDAGRSEDDLCLEDILADERAAPDSDAMSSERTHAVRDALGELPQRQRYVLARRYGLDGGDGCTLKTLAGELGVSKERVRQIEAQAFGRLRETLHASLAAG